MFKRWLQRLLYGQAQQVTLQLNCQTTNHQRIADALAKTLQTLKESSHRWN